MSLIGGLAELADVLEEGSVLTDRDVIAAYRHDWARDPAAGWPTAVVRARSTGDVQAVMRWAADRRVPVVVRGAGTGLSGGATAADGGIVLSVERLRGVRVDPVTRTATAGAGVLNVEVKRAAAEHALWYPPDPSSFESSSIGGNVATNAGGLCCVKYGVTTDYVLGMEVVLADGTALRLGGPRVKDVAGLSLIKLFTGSEGLLGIITEVTVRLVPLPPPSATLVGTFASVDAAAAAVVAVTSAVRPSMLELLDRVSVNAVEDALRMNLDRAAEALIIARSDAPGVAAREEVAAMERICREAGATETFATTDPDEGEMFAAARREVLPALERRGSILLEDVGVSVPRLPALVRGIESIADRYRTVIAVIAHAGDGNTHPVIVFDPRDAEAAGRARLAFTAIMELALELDGTITGEHGVGRMKRQWLPAYLGEDAMDLTRRIKHALDPQWLLNPGVMMLPQ
jgi:glycolate oxidase